MLLPYIHELYDWCAYYNTVDCSEERNGYEEWITAKVVGARYCPTAGFHQYSNYKRKKDDRSTLIFQATIDKMTRIEVINDEGETINVIRIWTDAHRCEDLNNA